MGKYSSGLNELYGNDQKQEEPKTDNTNNNVSVEPNQTTGRVNLPPMDYSIGSQPEPSNGPGLGEALGGAALGYGAYKVNQATMLPKDARNNAINVRQTNQALDRAMQAHAVNQNELDEAQAGHDFWNHPDTIEAHINPADLPEPPAKEPVTLDISHEGGPGVENYEAKFVPKEFDANSPSMSHVQREVIPANEAASVKTQQLAPGTVIDKETGLALTPEAQREQLVRKQTAIDAQKAKEEADKLKMNQARANAEIKIQPQREAAKARLDLAQTQANQTQQELNRLTNKSAQQTASLNNKLTDISPAQASNAEKIANEGSKFGDLLETGGRFARKVLGPVNAAMIPYEFNQAVDAYKSGDTTGAIKHGINVAGGLAQYAPAAAAVGLMAPEVAAGTAIAGGLAGAGTLAHDVYENWPEIKKWGQSHLPDSWTR